MVVPRRPLFARMSRTILFYPAGKTVEGLRPRAAPGICAGQRTGPGYLIIYSKTKPGRREVSCHTSQTYFRNFVKKREKMLDNWETILYYK